MSRKEGLRQRHSFNFDEVVISVRFPDVSVASKEKIPAPFNGEIKAIKSSLGVAITTAAAATISVKIDGIGTAGTSVTGGDITIAAGSVEGAIDYSTPTANNTVDENDLISVESDGGSTTNTAGGSTTAPANVYLIMRRDQPR